MPRYFRKLTTLRLITLSHLQDFKLRAIGLNYAELCIDMDQYLLGAS